MPRKIVPIALAFLLAASGLIWSQAAPPGPGPGPGAPPQKGLLVSEVLPDSPAQKAGLLRGDILLSVDGKEINALRDLREILSTYRAGQRVTLGIQRGGQARSVPLTLEDRLYRSVLGLRFAPSPDRIGAVPPGAWIVEVQNDSPAAKAGLQRGDAILTVDGQLATPRAVLDAVRSRKPGDTISLQVARRGAARQEIQVELASGQDGGPYLGIQMAAVPFGGHGFSRRGAPFFDRPQRARPGGRNDPRFQRAPASSPRERRSAEA
jgi:S1-C subfamily serine protease